MFRVDSAKGMVSPSKPPNFSRVASHQKSPKCKLVKGLQPLINHRFYLDIEKHNVSSKIELKIKELGGSIEFFLAKEVTHFVTDKTHSTLNAPNRQSINSPSPLLVNNHQQQLTPKTPKTPLTPYTPSYLCDSPNVSHAANDSKDQPPKHRSRADAMLQRARLTQQSCDQNSAKHSQQIQSHSPVQLAKSWGTPIWTPEYTLRFLEKVTALLDETARHPAHRHDQKGLQTPQSAHKSSSARYAPRPANPKRLRGEYIKVEAQDRHYRPFYKEFKYWPTISLDNEPGYCPFSYEPKTPVKPLADKPKDKNHPNPSPPAATVGSPSLANTMTRKSRSKPNRPATVATPSATAKATNPIKTEQKCGYCEICRTEYETLTDHLQSKEHQNFVMNGDNFLALDSLISNSANVQSFLSLNRVDDAAFGKRTAGKKVGKLFRATNEIKRGTSDEHLPNVGTRVNGTSNGLPTVQMMVTRRSNSKRSDDAERKKKASRKLGKCTSIVVKQESDEEDNDADHGDNGGDALHENMELDEANPDEDISENESSTNRPHKLRSRRESAKRINYAEPHEEEENATALDHTSKKIQKIRLRSVRWRPPSNEERSGMSQPFYKVIEEPENKPSQSNSRMNRKEAANDTNKSSSTTVATTTEDTTGSLKLRVCRVRESELSLLTNEADKFMFPRLSSDAATDEDRQSTSEPADISVDILSSEVDHYRAANSSLRLRNQELDRSSSTTTRELDCTNKKKRRNQLEAFLNDNSEYYKFDNPDSRLRFQEAPFQPTLTRVDAHQRSSTSSTTTRNSSSSDQFSSGRAPHGGPSMICSSMATSTSPWTSPSSRKTQSQIGPMSHKSETASAQPKETEDRKGASSSNNPATAQQPPTNTDQSHLLRTDVVKMHKFAFERIPSSEPWYEAFQRQDECRERIFEYWGSTAYRKLPFELGPLPPHSPDCCPVAYMKPTKRPPTNVRPNHKRKTKGKSKRGQHMRKHASASNNPSVSSGASSPVAEPPPAAREPTPPVDPVRELRIQKRLLMLQKHLRTNALPALHNPKPSATTTRSDSLEKKMHKRKLPNQRTEDHSRGSNVDTKLGKTSSSALKKEPFLLDINGRPRKSPREHASTLAILSCLVQQKRKRDKELNGGVSPEKMTRRSTVQRDDFSPSEDDEEYQSDVMETNRRAAPAAEMEEENSLDSYHTTIQTVVKRECDSDPETIAEARATPDVEENSNSTTFSTVRPIDAPVSSSKPATPTRKRDSTFPRMPICDYVSPHLICRQIDELFSADVDEYDELNFPGSYDIPLGSCHDPDDLVLVGTPKDFLDIVTSVEDGPLRCRSILSKTSGLSSFSRRKRKNNKTGWPSIPRRRMALMSGETVKADGQGSRLPDLEDDTTCSASNATEIDDEESKLAPTSPERPTPIDITQRLQSNEYSISRDGGRSDGVESFHGKFTEFGMGDGRASVLFTSSSDKAENSDIFTVSSDSLDTADMTTGLINAAGSSGIATGSTRGSPPPGSSNPIASPDSMTQLNHFNAKAGGSSKAALLSDESSSVDETLAELLQNRIASAEKDDDDTKTIRRGVRSTNIDKPSKTSNLRRVDGMQPIIRVRKMTHKMLMSAAHRRRSRLFEAGELLPERRGNETPPPISRTEEQAGSPIVTITGSGRKSISRHSCSPNTKFSPPKLRKPRGRWYRER